MAILELSQAKKKLILIAGGAALFLFFSSNFYLPSLANIKKLKKELKNLKAENERIGGSIKILSQMQDINSQVKEIDSLYQKYIPDEKSVAQLLIFLSAAAEKYNINLVSIEPGNIVSAEMKILESDLMAEYSILPIQAMIKASPESLADFLNWIGSRDRLVSLSSIEIGHQDQDKDMLNVRMTLYSYALNKINLPEGDAIANTTFRQAQINRILKPIKISGGNHFSKDDFKIFKIISSGQSAGDGNLARELTGIIFSPTKKVAVIGGQLYREGDMVDGRKIIEIQEDKVILQDDKNQYILELGAR